MVLCTNNEVINFVSVFRNHVSTLHVVRIRLRNGMYRVISNWSQTDMILPKCLLFYIIFSVMPGKIFGHLGHMGTSTVSKMVLYWRRWYHILAFIETNTIALGVQSFAAGANMICLTYTRDW